MDAQSNQMNPDQMMHAASDAAAVMKVLSHPVRMLLVCQLADGEKSVSQLVQSLGERQSGISQQLAILRDRDMVITRRDKQTIFYSIKDERLLSLVKKLYELFCNQGEG